MSAVKAQYEAFPYPPRDPEDERKRFILGLGDSLAAIDHAVFGGKRDWSKPFRVLVAGGGTGDSAIAIAQQLAQKNIRGEVTYLDLSTASRRIAEKRASIRRLKNISFHTGSLLDLSPARNGTFDFINCSGVLHHLDQPEVGIRALVDVLEPDGGMILMVYAALGRAGIYPMRDMLNVIAPPTEPAERRVRAAKALLHLLPGTNLIRQSRNIIGSDDPAELFDLLLHSVDKSYLIKEFNELLTGAGLRISRFTSPCLYNLASWCNDEETLSAVGRLDELERAAFTERFVGFLIRHEVFSVRADNKVAQPIPHPGAVLTWCLAPGTADPMGSFFKSDTPSFFSISLQEMEMNVTMSEPEMRLIRLIDGARTIGQIETLLGASPTDFVAALSRVWTVLNGAGVLLLRG